MKAAKKKPAAKVIASIKPKGRKKSKKNIPTTDDAKAANSQKTEGEKIVAEINKDTALVIVGGKHAILRETDDTFDLWTPGAYAAWMETQPLIKVVTDDKIKWTDRASLWRKHKNRRQYSKITFDPSGKPLPKDHYNIWKGFRVKPSTEGSCSLFLAHLLDNVAQGDEGLYQYILGHLAQWTQQPTVKLGVALAFLGPQGVGKSIVGVALSYIYGPHLVVVDNPQALVGNFNSHLAHSLIIQAEESFWAGDKKAEGALKHLITADTRLLEFKGKDKIPVPNYSRLMITSNEK
jgi:hypothetical protein